MKIDSTVKKETLNIAVGELICSTIMISVYLISGIFSINILISVLASSLTAVLNFFLMGLTIQKAIKIKEEDNITKLIRSSQMLRLLMVAVIVIICYAVFKLNVIALLIPLLFPRIILFIKGIRLGRSGKNTHSNSEDKRE